MSSCLHCASPSDDDFCCRGCESVYHLIHDQGMELFYDLRANDNLSPAREMPFQERDWSWLEQKIEAAEAESDGESIHQLQLGIGGISCMACVWLVESVVKKLDGVVDARVDSDRGAVDLAWKPGSKGMRALGEELQHLGYELQAHPSQGSTPKNASLAIRLGVCGGLAMNTMAFTLPRYTGMETSSELSELFTTITIASATLTFLIGGSYFFRRAWAALRLGGMHMDLPISLGLIIAFIGSVIGWLTQHESLFYFDFVAAFTFLMLLGKQIQLISMNRANKRFKGYTTVPEFWMTPEGNEIPTQELTEDSRIIIPPGVVIPVAAKLEEESADLSLAWITGEPCSRVYHRADALPAGAVNQSSQPITIWLSQSIADDDNFQRLFSIAQGTHSDSARQQSFQKGIQWYLGAIILLGFLTAGIWWFSTGDIVRSLQVLISIFVVSCPCGIGLALPLLETRMNKRAQENGVFPLKERFWDKLKQTTRLVFDKTGTLTLDRPALQNTEALKQLNSEQLRALFTLTRRSLHPLSRALFSNLVELGVSQAAEDTEVYETPGFGSQLTTKQHTWSLGRISWLAVASEISSPLETNEQLCCEFRYDGQLVATFLFNEAPREGARAALEKTKQWLSHAPTILSGDSSDRVQEIAAALGIKHVHGSLLPDDKELLMKELEAEGPTLYFGDGANDLLALQQASLSGAPFANVNVLADEVDFLFTDETFHFLPSLFRIQKDRESRKRQLIVYTIVYNLVVLAVCAAGLMTPLIAAVIMPLSSILSIAIVSRR